MVVSEWSEWSGWMDGVVVSGGWMDGWMDGVDG